LDQKIGDLVANGMNPEEARRRARLEFGGLDQVKEECRDVGGAHFIEILIQDLRYGLRQLRRSTGFTAVAVLTLALGLAAVNTIFAVVETVLLRPLDYPRSERIVTVFQDLPTLVSGPTLVTMGEFQRWEGTGLFEHAAAIDVTDTAEFTLLGKGRPEQVSGVWVTPDFFRVFGVQPLLGRVFDGGDAIPGHDNVIVLSHLLWQRSFGGDPHVVGQSVRMREWPQPLTIVGVMPPRFDFPRLADMRIIQFSAPEQTEFWLPLTITQGTIQQGNFNYGVVGRLKDGVTPLRATEQFRAAAMQLFRDEVKGQPHFRDVYDTIVTTMSVHAVSLRRAMSWGMGDGLWLLLAAVGLLLALVLFNLGNLLLTRSAGRVREFVVRETLGATRWQIFRQSVAEQILVVAGAATLSLLLAYWGVSAVRAIGAARLPRLYDLNIDARVTVLLVVLSLAISLLFGWLPLVVLRRWEVNSVLQSEGRSATADRRTNRLTAALMVTQISVSAVLLIAAGLLIQSFSNVIRTNPGFDPRNLLNVTIRLNPRPNSNAEHGLARIRALLDALRAIPGVECAAAVNHIPMTGEVDIHDVHPVGQSGPLAAKSQSAEYRVVSADYFHTMCIPVLTGRAFREDEPKRSAIVNQKMAAHLWPGQNAIGKQFQDADNPPVTIIGVVGDIRSVSLEREPKMQFYVPMSENLPDQFIVRTRIDPAALLPAVRQTVWGLDPEQAVSHPQMMERLMSEATLDRRAGTALVAGFAGTALLLATIGLFSIASLSAVRRTREFGVRLAVGAKGSDLLKLELGRTLTMVATGLACGVAACLALAWLLAGFLYGVRAWSPTVFGVSILALIVPTFIAGWLPARRAAKVDPMVALRYE
jgi:putative ABC transport system permease protein